MKSLIDTKLVRILTADGAESTRAAFVDACAKAGIVAEDHPLEIDFEWSSLLEYLGLGALFKDLQKFDEHDKLFTLLIETLSGESEKDFIIRLYDQIFVEALTYIKALPHIQPVALLERIQKKRQSCPSIFSKSLERYAKRFEDDLRNTMHDLVLYLAYDRVSVHVATLFDYASPGLNHRKGLDVVKECLLESFQHISEQGRTAPGLFRLLEALYAYQMREEHLQSYTESEWLTLCQSAQALRPREELMNVPYVAIAVVDCSTSDLTPTRRVFTMDSSDKVTSTLAFARYMLGKLQESPIEWRYTLCPVESISVKDTAIDFEIIPFPIKKNS